jgi:hypothetical protein
MAWTKAKTAIVASAVVIFSVVSYKASIVAIQLRGRTKWSLTDMVISMHSNWS